jgi:hypothetical protein
MKRFLSIVALYTIIAAPAFAQSGSHAGSDRDAQWSSRVHVYAPDYYVRRGTMNNEVNPDFQLGGSHGN